jgi:hypothetical protein
VACQAVGTVEKTYYEWIKKGEAGIEPYIEFVESIKKAKSRSYNEKCINYSNCRSKELAICWLLA